VLRGPLEKLMATQVTWQSVCVRCVCMWGEVCVHVWGICGICMHGGVCMYMYMWDVCVRYVLCVCAHA
jgi:hypothetical protein